jgi:hypothetical protein
VTKQSVFEESFMSSSHVWTACPNRATCLWSKEGHENPPTNPPGGAHSWASCGNKANCPLSQSGHAIPLDEVQSLRDTLDVEQMINEELRQVNAQLIQAAAQLNQVNLRYAALVSTLTRRVLKQGMFNSGPSLDPNNK